MRGVAEGEEGRGAGWEGPGSEELCDSERRGRQQRKLHSQRLSTLFYFVLYLTVSFGNSYNSGLLPTLDSELFVSIQSTTPKVTVASEVCGRIYIFSLHRIRLSV